MGGWINWLAEWGGRSPWWGGGLTAGSAGAGGGSLLPAALPEEERVCTVTRLCNLGYILLQAFVVLGMYCCTPL